MNIFRDEKLGLYYVATVLSNKTGESCMTWLKRLAVAITNKVELEAATWPGENDLKNKIEPEPKLSIPYFELRKMDVRGLQALEKLSEEEIYFEPECLECDLGRIFVMRDQLIPWLEKNYEEFKDYRSEKDGKKVVSENDQSNTTFRDEDADGASGAGKLLASKRTKSELALRAKTKIEVEIKNGNLLSPPEYASMIEKDAEFSGVFTRKIILGWAKMILKDLNHANLVRTGRPKK